MKKNMGRPIEPYEFSVEQITRLVDAGWWNRPANRKKAECFVKASQGLVEEWLTLAKGVQTKAPVKQSSANKIQKAAKKLRDALNASPEDVNLRLSGGVDNNLLPPPTPTPNIVKHSVICN